MWVLWELNFGLSPCKANALHQPSPWLWLQPFENLILPSAPWEHSLLYTSFPLVQASLSHLCRTLCAELCLSTLSSLPPHHRNGDPVTAHGVPLFLCLNSQRVSLVGSLPSSTLLSCSLPPMPSLKRQDHLSDWQTDCILRDHHSPSLLPSARGTDMGRGSRVEESFRMKCAHAGGVVSSWQRKKGPGFIHRWA